MHENPRPADNGSLEMGREHPTEVQLVEWLDAEDDVRSTLPADAHVHECSYCRVLVAEAGEPVGVPSVLVGSQSTLEVPEPREFPTSGQVWRLTWNDVSELALVWRAIDDYFSVVPVRPDPDFADERTIIIESGSSVLPGDIALWFGMESYVPPAVFDRFWFEMDVGSLTTARTSVRERKPVEAALVRTGVPITNALDARYEYREDLADRCESLIGANWRHEHESSRSFAEMVNDAGCSWSDVTEVLGLHPHDRLRLMRGQLLFEEGDAERVSIILNVTADEVLATNPAIPNELASALDRPKWKPRIREERRVRCIDEGSARYHLAFAALTLATRERTAPSTPEQWDVRLEHVFAS